MAARKIAFKWAGGRGPIEIDDVPVHGIRGFTVSGDVDSVPTATLDVIVREAVIDGEAYVDVPEKTRNTLIHLGWTPPAETVELAPNPEVARVYRERAHLVAYLAAVYPSAIVHDADPEAPGWAIIYVHTPQGQMSWHLSGDDLDLFGHVSRSTTERWDGHSTDGKYERLAACTQDTYLDHKIAT